PPAQADPPPPDHAARQRIRTDTSSTLFVEAGAGAGKTTALVGRILTLVDEGVPIDEIAAITFTEKAAAELRHRLREQLTVDIADDVAAARRRTAVDALDHAPIGTLHAFARRILFEFPVEAGLPPGFGVLDELESQLALDERWEDLLEELLDDADREVVAGLPASTFVQLISWGTFGHIKGLRQIVEDFQANWDLVDARVALDAPVSPGGCDDVLRCVDEVVASSVPEGDGQDDLLTGLRTLASRMRATDDLATMLHGLASIRDRASKAGRIGNQGNWRVHGGKEALGDLRRREADLASMAAAHLEPWREYRRLVVGAIAARFVLAGARDRAAAGTLEFHDLLVLARRLLTTSDDARRRLHDRYTRVLLDEFQDTDPIQLEIAVRLTAPPQGQPADPASLRPVPGRLFVVGDPKQSIYRFRRADIAVYLAAGEQIGAEPAVLSANFRSTDAVIEWVNGVFSEVIRPEPGVQPAYGPLDACRPGRRDHGRVHVVGVDPHEDAATAKELREREATSVATAVATALREGWPVGDGDGGLRPCRAGDIAVLLPARTSLPMLEPALATLAVPYRAENASVVYAATEIRHLMLALRAAADPTDELALVAALRSPLYGCSDVELFDWKVGGGRWNRFADVPDELVDHPVGAAIAHIGRIGALIGRATPAELLDRIVEDRRLLEVALGGPDGRDVWRRIRFVVDQARAWTDAGGRGVRRYLRWTAFQAAEGRASDTILPERDHDAVRIMTVHAAKGLEFPITVVSGLSTKMMGVKAMSVVWPPGSWTLAEKDSAVFEAFKPVDEQMGDAERRRLLYVACTRAVDHLVVSLHRKPENTAAGTARSTSATVLAEAGAAGHGATPIIGSVPALDVPFVEALELPWSDPGAYEAERARAIALASRRSATSATRLAMVLARDDHGNEDDDVPPRGIEPPASDSGLMKDGVDLDLPPWQRGRYGTAIGRAVHAVLQDADLVEGGDVDRLAAAQCAAEGIFGMEERVGDLCRSALAAPIVRQAAGGAEHWRELFVVADLGGTVLEGYIDLLVRTDDGLVIVDYKTDQWRPGADQAARVARYRHQLAAYGVALGRLLDEPVAGGMLVRCRPGGPAEQIDIPDWAAALEAVAEAAGVGSGASVGHS
ncbi:MAG: UvrD-helicase domain-containing protein, partial [Ilumatobacteraceae bacterium]